jgi:hypothetical protein
MRITSLCSREDDQLENRTPKHVADLFRTSKFVLGLPAKKTSQNREVKTTIKFAHLELGSSFINLPRLPFYVITLVPVIMRNY